MLERPCSRENPSSESKDEQFARVFCNAARTHLDLLMKWEDWGMLGFRNLVPLGELPDEFRWTIYVEPSSKNGLKRVGIKLFGSTGLVGVYEVSVSDSTLHFSDGRKQKLIDEEMCGSALLERKRRQEIESEEIVAAERKRGFPAGEYELLVNFPVRGAERYVLKLTSRFHVDNLESYDNVVRRVAGEVAVTGLHNWGLEILPSGTCATVNVAMKRADVSDIPFEVKVNANGHVVSDEYLG